MNPQFNGIFALARLHSFPSVLSFHCSDSCKWNGFTMINIMFTMLKYISINFGQSLKIFCINWTQFTIFSIEGVWLIMNKFHHSDLIAFMWAQKTHLKWVCSILWVNILSRTNYFFQTVTLLSQAVLKLLRFQWDSVYSSFLLSTILIRIDVIQFFRIALIFSSCSNISNWINLDSWWCLLS